MPFSIYTYSNPYEINKELYWDSIKNCPHFCVSQTMANGMMGTYEEMTAGKVSTVENLVKGLFAYWESSECKIKQYTVIDEAINRLNIVENEDKIKQSLRFNRKQLSNSLRILFELDMSIEEMRTELMTEEQRHLVEIYSIIRKSDLVQYFTLNVLGKRSWNFDGADRRVYRVQLWTEKIKRPLIEAITMFENREIDYFKCAMMAEFYRVILFGLSKATTVDGLKSEHILDNGIRGLGVNSHSDAWNSLLGIITRSENDKINRDTVIQYCNVIQGESHAQVFLDREKFDVMVRTVKNEKLTVESSVLDLVDPVKLRRDARDYLRMILERLEKVQEDELAKADAIMMTIKDNFGTTNVDDEDIEDMVEKIVEFYRTAEDGKLPGKYDQELFDEVKKYSTSTSKAIKEIVAAKKTTNALDCILAFSQDPIRKVEKLDQLLKKVVADIAKIQSELEVRKAKLGGGSNPSGSDNVFDNEKTTISECSRILARLEGTVC